MASGFKINKQAIAQMTRELEREFNKNGGIRINVEADASGVPNGLGTYNNYSGPVLISHGDHAQIAFGNRDVNQSQNNTAEVTPGFEDLAAVLATLLQQLSDVALDDDDKATAQEVGEQLLTEVTQPEPDRGVLRRGITALKGVLAPIAAGLSAGVGQAVNDETQEWAHKGLELLQGVVF